MAAPLWTRLSGRFLLCALFWLALLMGMQRYSAQSQSKPASPQGAVKTAPSDAGRRALQKLGSTATRLATETTPLLGNLLVLGTVAPFVFEIGGAAPPVQHFPISTTNGSATFTVATTGTWLKVNPASGQSTPASITVSADPTSLAPGKYPGSVVVTSPNVDNNPQTALTDLTVLPTVTLDALVLSPGVVNAPYAATLTATGGLSPYVKWTATGLPPGLSISTATGAITGTPTSAAGSPFRVTAQVTDSLGVVSQLQTYIIPVTQPNAIVAPGALSFSAHPDDTAPPAPQRLSVFAPSNATLTYATIVETADGGAWLTASGSGYTPGMVTVSVNPAGLLPGSYSGVVHVFCRLFCSAIYDTSVPVSLLIANAPTAPTFSVEPTQIQFGTVRGAAPSIQQLIVSNNGGGTLHFDVQSSGGSWLSGGVTGGSAAGGKAVSIPLTIDPSGFTAGIYTATAIVRNSDTGDTVNVPVSLALSSQSNFIGLTQKGLQFTAAAGGGSVLPQSLGIFARGQGTVNWTAAAQTVSGGDGWLTVSPASGTSSEQGGASQVTVSVIPAGLPAGQYAGLVKISSTGAVNSPQTVAVLLNVTSTDSGTASPQIDQHGLIFVGQSGAADSPARNIAVFNPSGQASNFRSTYFTDDGKDWLAVPASGTLSPDRPSQIAIQLRNSILTPGIRKATIRLGFADGSVQPVSVTSIVTGPPANGIAAAAGCVPSSLVLEFLSPGNGFTEAVTDQDAVRVLATDDCGNPVTSGGVAVDFSTHDPLLNLTHQGNGVWAGTWVPAGRDSNVTLTAIAFARQPSGSTLLGRSELSGTVLPPSHALPPIPGAVLSPASFAGLGQVSPGSLTAILGNQMASGTALGGGPYPAQLSGVSVSMGGRALPLQYVSTNQINALVPFDVARNTILNFTLQRDTSISVPMDIIVTDFLPAIYTVNAGGSGQGAILYSGTRTVVDGNAPAATDDAISIYCSGLGDVDNPPAPNAAAPASPLARTLTQPQVTIGGVPTVVSFSGLAPGTFGLYQIDVKIPSGVSSGSAVPVIVTAGTAVSNVATIAVK
jgi:uncharacterized protein (TIGR03437 family)